MLDRVCGTCTLCCTSAVVEAFDKPSGVTCEHVCMTGCAIYPKRPHACAVYSCSWLEGLFEEEHRPDKTGVVFECATMEGTGGSLEILMGLIVKKLLILPETFKKYVKDGLIISIANISTDESYLFGKEKDIRLWAAYMKSIKRQGGIDAQFADAKRRIEIG